MLKDSEFNSYLSVAKEAAITAGGILADKLPEHHNIKYKGAINLVTDMDTASEEMIKNFLLSKFPSHSLISEEGTKNESGSSWCWFVDPLDGTTNYAHGFPWFAVSIGLCYENTPVLGVIYNPVLGKIFWGGKNKGVFMGDMKISVSKEKELNKAFLSTGFPYDLRENPRLPLSLFGAFAVRSQAIRRAGSASLDLAYVAAGIYDGFWEIGLFPWDIAAGIILIEEAGGKVTDFNGNPVDIYGKEILAANEQLHKQMLEIIKTTSHSYFVKQK